MFIETLGEKNHLHSKELAVCSEVLNEMEAKAWMHEKGLLEVMIPKVEAVDPVKKKYPVNIKVVGLAMTYF